MSTILVEDRKSPECRLVLDAIAEVCRSLGHDTFRWRGPLSGRVAAWPYIFDCDLAILFNGTHDLYRPSLEKLDRLGTKRLFVELGWHPQKGSCQVDPAGINIAADWARAPLAVTGCTRLPVRSGGDLLLVLQLDNDTQIRRHSPHFPEMASFVEFVCRHSVLPVRIRHHPRHPPTPPLQALVRELGGTWDQSPNLAAALEPCRAIACINSSCGVEALAYGLPVLCYGEAIYRHPSAVYCLDGNAQATRDATAELADGRCSLTKEAGAAALARILDHQWTPADLATRLPPLLCELLPDGGRAQPGTGNWLAACGRFLRDLPGIIFPRRQAA